MSVLDLLKTTPGMASVGSASVGGAALSLWGAGVFGSGNYPSYKQLSDPTKTDAKAFIGNDYETQRDTHVTNLSQTSSTSEDEVNKTSDYYGNISTKCMKAIFGEVSFHSEDKFKLDKAKKEKPSDAGKIEDPKEVSSGYAQGCSSISLSSYGKHFLMTSEAAVRTGNIGMALWTGIKNAGNPFQGTGNKAKIHVRHFVAFFSSKEDNSGWDLKGGYSWGGKSKEIELEKITIRSPDSSKINTTFDENYGIQGKQHQYYYGTWQYWEGDSEFIDLKEDPYSNSGTELVFSPNKAQGYKETNAFLKTDDTSSTTSWQQYCDSGTSCDYSSVSKVNVSKSVEEWLKPFKNLKGKWISSSK